MNTSHLICLKVQRDILCQQLDQLYRITKDYTPYVFNLIAGIGSELSFIELQIDNLEKQKQTWTF